MFLNILFTPKLNLLRSELQPQTETPGGKNKNKN